MDPNENFYESGMVNIEIEDLVLSVDKETAHILQTDSDARKSYIRQIKQQLARSSGDEPISQSKTPVPKPVPVWKTSKNQTERDRTATIFFLSLRKQHEKEFADKNHNKNSIWSKIATIMNNSDFYVGDGTDGREKCRQKFSNLQTSYLKYMDRKKMTGEGKIIKPPYFDELDDILGDKHKSEPVLVLDSLPGVINNEPTDPELSEKPSTSNSPSMSSSPSTSNSNRFTEVKTSVKPNKNDISQKIYELNKENQKINENNFQQMMEFLNKESNQRHKQIMCLIENMGKTTKKKEREPTVMMILTEIPLFLCSYSHLK